MVEFGERLKSVLLITSGVGIILGYLVFFRRNYNEDDKKGKTEKDKLESCLKTKESKELNKCQEEKLCSKSSVNGEVSYKGLDNVGGKVIDPESVLNMGGSLWNIKVVTAANKLLKDEEDEIFIESFQYVKDSNESLSTEESVQSPLNNAQDPLNTTSQNTLITNPSEQVLNVLHDDLEIINDLQKLSKPFKPLCNASESITNNDKSFKDSSNFNIPIKKSSTPIYNNKNHDPTDTNILYNNPCGDYFPNDNASYFDESWPHLDTSIESPPVDFILPTCDLKRIEEWDLEDSPRTSPSTPNINLYSLFINTSINSPTYIYSSNSETSSSSATNSFSSFSSASLSSNHAVISPVSTHNTPYHSVFTSSTITSTRGSVSDPGLCSSVAKQSRFTSSSEDLFSNNSTPFQPTVNSELTNQQTINSESTNQPTINSELTNQPTDHKF